MSLHEDINAAIQDEITAMGDAHVLSPSSLALAVQRRFAGPAGIAQPHIQYASLEHLKQMARKALARNFEPDSDETSAYQGEMFSGQLQDRYPIPRKAGHEPQYKLRHQLDGNELQWNIALLRKSAAARLQHADALQAWGDMRCAAA